MIQAGIALCPPASLSQVNSKKRNVTDSVERKEDVNTEQYGAWTNAVLRIIEEHKEGITYSDLKLAVKNTPFAYKLQNNDNAVYGVVEKLSTKRKKVIKHNSLLFSSAAYRDALAKGVISESDKQHYSAGQRSPTGEKLMEFLRAKDKGAKSYEISNELKKYPELSKSLENKSFIYNVLASLKKKNLIKKEGEVYYAVS